MFWTVEGRMNFAATLIQAGDYTMSAELIYGAVCQKTTEIWAAKLNIVPTSHIATCAAIDIMKSWTTNQKFATDWRFVQESVFIFIDVILTTTIFIFTILSYFEFCQIHI